ncbi:MAG: hypothetical protein Q4F72_11050, partial [Desulfovibrionaceae bacterium]|nr:hypothetical protein [Desulfovibrionaceae bacterium]
MTQTSKRSGGRETATQTECRHLFMMLDALFSPREDDSSRLFQSLRELQALPRELYGSSMVESFRRQVGRKLKGSYGGSSNASMDCRLRFDLCCQAVNDVQLTLLLGRLTTDRDFLATPMGCAMAQVVALFRNSEAVFRELQQVEPVSAFASYARMAFVRCCWFTQEWFHSRSQYLQAVLLGDMVRSFGTEGAVHPVLVRALDDFARGRIQILGATADMLALAAFWQGAPARALALTEKPAHDLVGEGPRRMARALVSVFRGETGQALEDCREAVKALKKQMRVRGQLTIGQAPGLVLNLVRFLSGEEAELKEMRRVLPKLTQPALNSGDASIFGIPGFHGLAALDALRQGEAEHAGRIVSAVFHHGMRDDNCLSNLIFYAACARIDTDLPVGAAVRDWFRRCEGLPLLQRAFADILAEIPEEGGAGKWGRAGANQEPKLNVMQMVERMEDWQRSLYALETLANESGDAKKEKRLVWVLDPDNDDVEVLQQTLGQHGWSKGRALSLKNLDERAAGLNWLSEDERRIISYIEAGDWWNAQSVLRLSACCDALEGRDLLFMRARDGSGALVPVTLKRGRLEFRLEETGKGSYVLSFGAIDTEFGARAGYLFTCEDGVITYYKFDERERRALSLVGEGLKVPASELPRVLNLTRSNLNIAMRTDSVSAEDVEPVNSPVIQLEQTASGFAGTLGVRPFGRPDTMFFPTGEGALEPLASVPVEGDGPDGTSLGLARTLRVRRDFAAENEALAGLMNDCPTLAQGLEDRHWSTGDIEDVLGLLEELRASAVPNSVEWPRGHRLRLRGRLEAKDVKVRI